MFLILMCVSQLAILIKFDIRMDEGWIYKDGWRINILEWMKDEYIRMDEGWMYKDGWRMNIYAWMRMKEWPRFLNKGCCPIYDKSFPEATSEIEGER